MASRIKRASMPVTDLHMLEAATLYCAMPESPILARIANQLSSTQKLLAQARAIAPGRDENGLTELEANQSQVDKLIADIATCRGEVKLDENAPPKQFLNTPTSAQPTLAALANQAVHKNWRTFCAAFRKDPRSFSYETHITPTAADYVAYFEAQLNAGATELSTDAFVIVESH